MVLVKILTTLLALLAVAQGFTFKQVAVTLNNYEIRSFAQYTFTLSRYQYESNFSITPWNIESIPTGSTITIQFPTQFTPSLISQASLQSLSMTTDTGSTVPSPLPTPIISGNNIIIPNLFSNPTFVRDVTVTISNIQNPEPALKTDSFLGIIGTDQSAITTTGVQVSHVQFNPGALGSCSATFNAGFVNRVDNLTIALSALSVLASNSIVKVTFPAFYLRDPGQQAVGVASSMVCVTSLQTLGTYCNSTTSNYTVNIYNSVPVNGSLSTTFQIDNILVPPSVQTIDTITVSTYTSSMMALDTCTATLANINPISIPGLSVSSSQAITVNSQLGVTFAIPIFNPLYTTDSIIFTFSLNYLPIYTVVSLVGEDNNNNTLVLTMNSNTTNIINLSINSNLSSGSTLFINLSNIYAPPSTASVLTTNVEIATNGYLKASGSYSISPSANTITQFGIVPGSSVIGISNTYAMWYVNPDPLTSASMIRVTIPTEISLTTLSTVQLNGITVSFTVLPANIIQLTILQALPSNSNLTFTMFPIKNSNIVDPITSAFTIATYLSTNTNQLMNFGTFQPNITFQSSETIFFTVSSSSQIVNARNASWMFQITTKVPVPSGGSVKIWLSTALASALNQSTITCMLNQVIPLTCTLFQNNGTFEAQTSSISSGTATNFNLSLHNAMPNPPMTEPLYNFSVFTLSALGTILESSILSATTLLTISQPEPFTYFSISRNSSRNSDITSYVFNVQQGSTFFTRTSDINEVLITTPPELTFIECTCTICNGNCTTTFSNNQNLLVLNNVGIINLNTFSFTFVMKNSFSLQPPTTNFTIKTILNNVFNYSYSTYPNNHNELVNSQPASLALTSAVYSNFQLGSPNTLTLTIDNSNFYSSYYILTLDPSFIYNNVVCNFVNSNYSCTYDPTQHIIIINKTSLVNESSISLTVSDFNNSFAQPTTNLNSELSGYTANGYLVDTFTGSTLQWAPTCIFPCKTCDNQTSLSTCTSCYTNPLIGNFSLFDSGTSQCLTACFSDQIQLNNICVNCDPSCLQCSISSTNCTACNSSTINSYFFNNSCRNSSSCPQFYYASSTFQCLSCSIPCSQCNQTFCITCAVGYFFFSNDSSCLLNCPNGTFTNTTSTNCQPCNPVCATCSADPSVCTSCSSTAINFNSTCISSCAPLYINGSTCSASCESPCLTCQNFTTTCLSCIASSPSLFLYSSSCFTFCPTFFVKNMTAFTCDHCSTLNINCVNCQQNSNCSIFGGSVNCSVQQYYSCITCDNNFYLYFNPTVEINQCLSSSQVPDGYVPLNGIAELCSPECLLCSNLPNNCTSCSTLTYHQNQCLNSCPSQYFQNQTQVLVNTTNTTTFICSVCPTECLTCLNESYCLTCQNDFYLNGTFCVNSSSCPQFTYPNTTNFVCQPCVSPCLECFGYSACASCIASKIFYQNLCIDPIQCPLGTYGNLTTNACQNCNTPQMPCLTCSSNAVCLSCTTYSNGSSSYHFASNNTCLSQCPVGYYQDEALLICSICVQPCVECSQTVCSVCRSSYNGTFYYFYQGQCITICPDTTFANTTDSTAPSCSPCDVSCFTCSLSSTNCTKCNSLAGYSALSNATNDCRSSCPADQIVLKFNSTLQEYVCYGCSDALCQVCTAQDMCTLCLNNTLVLIDGVCYLNCPAGLVKNFSTTLNTSYCHVPIPDPALGSNIEGQVLQLPFYFPSCALAGCLLFIAIMIKAYQSCYKNNQNAVVFPLMCAAMAIPQFGTMCLSAGAYFLLRYKVFLIGPLEWDLFMYLYCLCILLSVITGIYVFIVQVQVTCEDQLYAKWSRQANCLQKIFQYCVNIITFFNFKISHSLWSGIKSLPFLESSKKLAFFIKPSAFSIIISLTFIIISGLNITYHPDLKLIYIDGIIVVAISAFLCLLALKRPDNFFIHQLNDLKPDLPVNKRVIESDDYLIISGMKSNEGDYSKLKSSNSKMDLISDSLLEDQSFSSRSEDAYSASSYLTQSLNKTPSVRLENRSLQCTVMEEHSDKSISYEDWSSTDRVPSVVVEPASQSNYQNMMMKSIDPVSISGQNQNEENQLEDSQFGVQIHPTNLAMVVQGDEQSHQGENDEQKMLKFVLPLQFRRYALEEQAPQNYSFKQDSQLKSKIQRNFDNLSQKAKQINKNDAESAILSMEILKNNEESKYESSFSSKILHNDIEQFDGRSKEMSASVNSKDPEIISVQNNNIVVEIRSNIFTMKQEFQNVSELSAEKHSQEQIKMSDSRQMNLNNSKNSVSFNIYQKNLSEQIISNNFEHKTSKKQEKQRQPLQISEVKKASILYSKRGLPNETVKSSIQQSEYISQHESIVPSVNTVNKSPEQFKQKKIKQESRIASHDKSAHKSQFFDNGNVKKKSIEESLKRQNMNSNREESLSSLQVRERKENDSRFVELGNHDNTDRDISLQSIQFNKGRKKSQSRAGQINDNSVRGQQNKSVKDNLIIPKAVQKERRNRFRDVDMKVHEDSSQKQFFQTVKRKEYPISSTKKGKVNDQSEKFSEISHQEDQFFQKSNSMAIGNISLEKSDFVSSENQQFVKIREQTERERNSTSRLSFSFNQKGDLEQTIQIDGRKIEQISEQGQYSEEELEYMNVSESQSEKEEQVEEKQQVVSLKKSQSMKKSSLSNSSRNKSLTKSGMKNSKVSNESGKKSLKKSSHSIGKGKSSIKLSQLSKRYEKDDGRDIVDEEAESIQVDELSDVSESRRKERSNQYRITTRKRKGKDEKQLILYIEDKKYKILKKEAKMLNRELRINNRIKRQIDEDIEQIYKPQVRNQSQNRNSRSKQKNKLERRGSLTKEEKVYLSKMQKPKIQQENID